MDIIPGFTELVDLPDVVRAAALLAMGPLLGWLIQRGIVRRMKRRVAVTTGADVIVMKTVHDILIVWLFVAGLFGAISILPLNEGLESGIQKLLLAILVISGTTIAARVAADFVKLYARRDERTMRSSSIFVNITRITVAVIGLLVLLQTLGVSITPILTALGVGGLAVALAMQDTLSNFFAGLQIIGTKKVRIGDFVRIESGEEGYVTDIDWRHTSLRQLPNNMLLVPNAKLVNSILTNYYYPEQEMSVLVQVGVSYRSNLEHVERVTVDVARQVLSEIEGGVADFEPFTRYHTFDDSSINFSVILRAREFTDQHILRHEFIKRLHERYEAEGIVIPFPIRTVEWADMR